MMGNGYGDRGWDGYQMMGSGDWIAMTLVMLFGLFLLGALLVWLIRGSHAPAGHPAAPPAAPLSTRSAAESTLDERFARGDIDEEEYLRRKQVLRS